MSPPHSPTISACSSLDSSMVVAAPQLGMLPATRRRLTQPQTHALVSVFEIKTHPSREERALLAAELGMELKAVNAWFQNRRRSLKKAWSGSCGWSKGSLPENKHVRPFGGMKTLPARESAISLDHIASSRELPCKSKAKAKVRAASKSSVPPPRPACTPSTPQRRVSPTAVPSPSPSRKNIWEHIPSSPPTRPSSPGPGDALLVLGREAPRLLRSLEWACANARAGRRVTHRARAAAKAASRSKAECKGDADVPMLVLEPRPQAEEAEDDTETDEDEDEEAITPNISMELLPAFLLPDGLTKGEEGAGKRRRRGKDVDMEAAMTLLGIMSPETVG
ncbi:uncharacterized protein BXZ73DRAFT_39395 [Epithele typhae]|uniref:uncharacterized protein n=1 Tax=Epithele typhae TaxID=378194 RepID=UPI0020083B33|nr:uncharacterized protein BXZ73DRAFT_39395 [Epithele typhae]KAH9944215.1 hypothetical protein BXZ73DRAFT_39395 [Epithele typhae]